MSDWSAPFAAHHLQAATFSPTLHRSLRTGLAVGANQQKWHLPWDEPSWTQGDTVKDSKDDVEDDNGVPAPDCDMSDGHRAVSDTGVTIIRQTVNAVAGESRNISVNAAGGNKGTAPSPGA